MTPTPATPADPQPGDFFLTQIAGEVGWGIRVLQGLNGDGFANYEHAGTYLGDGLIAEAEPGGARVAQLSQYANCTLRWSTEIIAFTGAERTAIVAAARGYVAAKTPYSFLDYGSIALKRFGIRLPVVVDYVQHTGHMICSQMVARCCYDAGHPLWPGAWTGDDTPGDLDQLLDQLQAAQRG